MIRSASRHSYLWTSPIKGLTTSSPFDVMMCCCLQAQNGVGSSRVVQQVIHSQVDQLLGSQSIQQYSEAYISNHGSTSLRHTAAAAEMLLLLQPDGRQRAVQLLLDSQAVPQQPGMELCSDKSVVSIFALVNCVTLGPAQLSQSNVHVLHWKVSRPCSPPHAHCERLLDMEDSMGLMILAVYKDRQPCACMQCSCRRVCERACVCACKFRGTV